VRSALPAAVEAFKAGLPRPNFAFKGRWWSIRVFWARLVNAVLPGMRRQAIFRYGSVSIAPPIEIAP